MEKKTQTLKDNPFFNSFNTPFGAPPFHLIKREHYKPAFDEGIKKQDEQIKIIIENSDEPTFENTIVALEKSGEMLERVEKVFFNLLSADTDDEMMKIAQEINPILSEHFYSITLNESLFEKIKKVYDSRADLQLKDEQLRLTEETYKSFIRSGAGLSPELKKEFLKNGIELSKHSLDFSQNVLKATYDFEFITEDEKDLSGLPESSIEAAAQRAREKNKNGYLFDLSAPSYVSFLKFSDRKDLRKKMYMAFSTRCTSGQYDNRDIVKKIVNLRLRNAQILGYETYADLSLKRSMMKTRENVEHFLNELFISYLLKAEQDFETLAIYAKTTEGKDFELEPWDWAYYSEKLKAKLYNIDEEETRSYFKLENVIEGVFGLATELYGISFHENDEIPTYHDDVKAYEVLNSDQSILGILYVDFFPRTGKQNGAWMTEFREQSRQKNDDVRPLVSIVMNFNKPTSTTPSLLTYEEVRTFLHEFGHALHGLFSKCTYKSLSGTNVFRDFVELPSQLMENWLSEKSYFNTFARHYITNEPLPSDLLSNITRASKFQRGYQCLRQLTFGFLDMSWHTIQEPFEGDPIKFEKKSIKKTVLIPTPSETCISSAFSHIFAGGYAAGYYSYKWSEVLEADAFELFKKKGIFNTKVANSFRENILEKGNTEDPEILFEKFKGSAPNVSALLKRDGIK